MEASDANKLLRRLQKRAMSRLDLSCHYWRKLEQRLIAAIGLRG